MASEDPTPSFLDLQRRPRRRVSSQPVFSFGPPPEEAIPEVSLLTEAEAPTVEMPDRLGSATKGVSSYTVRQLIAELRGHIEGSYRGEIQVEGEISNCRAAGSGHLYFTLKDGDAQLPVVMFRRQAQLLSFKTKDGLAVEVRGRISVYETRGQLQLIGETMRPRGAGALQLAFEQLRDRLRAEGLFDRPRKGLPAYPHCIGIITSASGAALHDMIQVIGRRHSRLNLLIYPAVMQGAQCAATVAAGIRWFNRHPDKVDLIVIARGGGSLEDLAGFNDEALARVIVASKLAIVSAIGHEVDHTIADLVADLRAPTPSAAAELITAAQHRVEERVEILERRVRRSGEFHLMRARQRLQRLSADQVLARLRDGIGRRQQRIDELRFRMEYADVRLQRYRAMRIAGLEARLRRLDPSVRIAHAGRRLESARERLSGLSSQWIQERRNLLAHAAVRLRALSPLAVLERGYAIVYLEGAVLRDAANAHSGQTIEARVGRGSVRATVASIDEG